MGKRQNAAGDDGYDLRDEGPVARPAKATPVLRYESKAVVQKEARERRHRLLEAWNAKALLIPGSLLVLGLACRQLLVLSHTADGETRAAVIMGLVALTTVLNVLAMLGGLMVAARLVDLEPMRLAPTVVKLGLIFVAGASAGAFVASLGKFSAVGIATGVNILFLIYWPLFAVLFKASVVETMMCIAIIGMVQALLNLGMFML